MCPIWRVVVTGVLAISGSVSIEVFDRPLAVAQVYPGFDRGYDARQYRTYPHRRVESVYDYYNALGYYDDHGYDYGDALRNDRLRSEYLYDNDRAFPYDYSYDPDYGYDYDYYEDIVARFYGEWL
jgi:hypothetical protein